MDSSVFENVNKTTKSLPNMPQHTGSLLDSSLVAKIARGLSGREGGVEEERGACWFVWDPPSPLPVLRPRSHGAPEKASCTGVPELFLLCHSVCRGRVRRPGITGHKVLPVSQGPLPAARMWGGWVNE